MLNTNIYFVRQIISLTVILTVAFFSSSSDIALAHSGHDHKDIKASFDKETKEIVSNIERYNNAILQAFKDKEKGVSNTKEITDLAKERKSDMISLLKTSPRAFIVHSVSDSDRNTLSNDVKEYVESEITVSGRIVAIHVDDRDPEKSGFKYKLHTDKSKNNSEEIELFLTKDIEINSGTEVTVTGVGYANILAVDTEGEGAFEVTSEVSGSGATGVQDTIVLLVDFNNSGARPFNKNQATNLINNSQFNSFYTEQSYNSVSWNFTVSEWTKLNRNSTNPCDVTNDELYSIAQSQGINYSIYDRIVVLSSINSSGGCSYVGKSNVWIGPSMYNLSIAWIGLYGYNQPSYWGTQPFSWTNLDYLLSHELGHSLGLQHGKGFDCGTASVYGNCSTIEYGNFYDVMGSNSFSLHTNSFYKDSLGWLASGRTSNITSSGTYTINPLENNTGTALATIYVNNPSNGSPTPAYALEYRRPTGFDVNLSGTPWSPATGGVMVNQIASDGYNEYVRLIDTSPTSDAWFEDISNPSILPGASFSDPGRGVSISVSSANANAVTFNVSITTPSCTRANPSTIWTYAESEATAGSQFNVQAGAVNNDYFGCGNSDFRIVPTNMPSGWTYSSDVSNISPDGNASLYSYINPSVSTPAGSYNITYRVENVNSGLYTTFSQTVNILAGPSISSVNPSIAQRNQTVTISSTNIAEFNRMVVLHPKFGGNDTWVQIYSQSTNNISFIVPNSIAYGEYDLKVFSNGVYTNAIDFTVAQATSIVINSVTPGNCSNTNGLHPNAIRINWSAPLNPSSVSYVIYRDGVEMYRLPKAYKYTGIQSFTDGKAEFSKTYAYTIREVYSNGSMSAPSNAMSASTVDFCPVTDLSYTLGSCAENTGGSVFLNWTRPAHPVASHAIYRNGTYIGVANRGSYDGLLTYEDKDLTPNTSLTYEVRAIYSGQEYMNSFSLGISGIGTSTPDSVSLNTNPACTEVAEAPAITEVMTIEASCYLQHMSHYHDDIVIYWNAPSNTNSLSHYVIRRDGEVIATTTELEYFDDGRPPNTHYSYTLSSVYKYPSITESPQSTAVGITSLAVCGQEETIPETEEKIEITEDVYEENTEEEEEYIEENIEIEPEYEEITEEYVEEAQEEEIVESESEIEEVVDNQEEETVAEEVIEE
jgi:M6 family metalloprotease-like protein